MLYTHTFLTSSPASVHYLPKSKKKSILLIETVRGIDHCLFFLVFYCPDEHVGGFRVMLWTWLYLIGSFTLNVAATGMEI